MSSSSDNPLDHFPAALPPEGQTSNFIDPPSTAQAVLVLNAVFMSFALVAFLIRLYVRARLTPNWGWGWEDLTCGLAVLCTIARTIFYVYQVRIGYGRHLWDIPASWLLKPNIGQLLNAEGIAYPLVLLFSKLSILLLYLRIFGISRRLQIAIYVLIAVMVVFYSIMLGFGIAGMFKCKDVTDQATYFCGLLSGTLIATNATFNFITDVCILSVPFPLLAKMRLRFRDKLGIAVVFTAGFVACAASLMRLIVEGITYHTTDALYYTSFNVMGATIETNILIVVACVSCFPAFYRRIRTYVSSTTSSFQRSIMTPKSTSHQDYPTETSATSVNNSAQRHEQVMTGGEAYMYIELPKNIYLNDNSSNRRHGSRLSV